MNAPKHLEISGNLTEHPLPELLVEIAQSRLDGSLRVSHNVHKIVIDFKGGDVVFAASNQRQHRIFDILYRSGKVTREQLTTIGNFTNDHELLKSLEEREILNPNSIRSLVVHQVETILKDSFGWKDGSWTFSSLARLKEEMCHRIDAPGLLLDLARNAKNEVVVRRFKSFNEAFGPKPNIPMNLSLLPQESFVYSRLTKEFLTVEEIYSSVGLSELEALKTLYSLWLGGFLYRKNWNSAFSERQIATILSAKLSVRKPGEAAEPAPVKAEVRRPVTAKPGPKPAEVEKEVPERELTLEEYLDRVENAATHYDTLTVAPKSDTADIKKAYFALAKKFHPDIYHRTADPPTMQRIQNAFTEIAHAYETLRHEDTRKSYDLRLGKVLEEMQKNGQFTFGRKEQKKPLTDADKASENFEIGFDLLMDEVHDEALPYLLSAVTLAPDIARYHAWYGKVLSHDESQRHKAEQEMQTAVRLEPDNPTFRMLLAEFFAELGQFKRAEGELNRLLAVIPNHPEAVRMLDSLQRK